jgi:hypothetical protein
MTGLNRFAESGATALKLSVTALDDGSLETLCKCIFLSKIKHFCNIIIKLEYIL